MPMPFDPRWLLPGGSLYNVAADGPGTFSTPVSPDGAPQQEPPKPPPENPPVTPRPPIFAGVGGMGTMAPMGTTAPVTPPTLAFPSTRGGNTKETVPAYGPGASQPSVTKAPTTPIEPAFNPDVREAVRKATPPGGTAAGTPAAQSGSTWDRVIQAQKEGKLGPMVSALAKSFGAGGGAPAPPGPYHMHMIGPTNPGFNQPQGASQMLQQVMEGGIGTKAQKAWEKKKSQRRSEQDRYDILGGRG